MDRVNPCPGSQQTPKEITIQPNQHPDGFNHMVGPTGKGTCGECGREIGLTTYGKLSSHSKPQQTNRVRAIGYDAAGL